MLGRRLRWLIRNGWTSAPSERVRERIAAKLAGMAQVEASTDEVYRMLLERSGLLREPLDGQTDFVHRTFQEYLAAAEAVATDDTDPLVANAWTTRSRAVAAPRGGWPRFRWIARPSSTDQVPVRNR